MEFFLKLAFQWKLSAKYSFLEHILSETGILIKLTKNLLFFLSNLRSRSSIKKNYMLSFARTCHPSPPVYLHSHFNGDLAPDKCNRNSNVWLYESHFRSEVLYQGAKNEKYKVHLCDFLEDLNFSFSIIDHGGF